MTHPLIAGIRYEEFKPRTYGGVFVGRRDDEGGFTYRDFDSHAAIPTLRDRVHADLTDALTYAAGEEVYNLSSVWDFISDMENETIRLN